MSARRSEGLRGSGRAHGAGTRHRQAAHGGGARPGAACAPRRLATDHGRRRALLSLVLARRDGGGVCRACSTRRVGLPPALRSPSRRWPSSRIEGGIILEGGYLSQSGRAGIKLFFNEGSKFELTPGTRGRLRAVAEDGAHLAVENGTAALQVTQSRQRRWLVEAGPFLVTVKGTAFTVSWDPSSERFELVLRHGHVVVSGPLVGGSIALLAGHRLVVSLPDAQTVITEEPPGEATASPSTPARRWSRCRRRHRRCRKTRPRDSDPSSARSSASIAKARGARNWAADLARGHLGPHPRRRRS